MRVEANLSWTSTSCAILLQRMNITKLFDLNIRVKITEYNIRNGPILWHISTSIKEVLEYFSPSLTVFEIFIFWNSWSWKCRYRSWCSCAIWWQISALLSNIIVMVAFSSVYLSKQSTEKFDHENLCHGHAVQQSLWSHLMANINLLLLLLSILATRVPLECMFSMMVLLIDYISTGLISHHWMSCTDLIDLS